MTVPGRSGEHGISIRWIDSAFQGSGFPELLKFRKRVIFELTFVFELLFT